MVSSAVASVKVRRPTQNPRRSPIRAGDRRFQRGEASFAESPTRGIRAREATTAGSCCQRSRRTARSILVEARGYSPDGLLHVSRALALLGVEDFEGVVGGSGDLR